MKRVSSRLPIVLLSTGLAILLVHLLGIVAIALYYEPANNIGYATRLDITTLSHSRVTWRSIALACGRDEVLLLGALLLTPIGLLFSDGRRVNVIVRTACILQLLYFYWGGMAIFVFPAAIAGPLRGEMLAEHWPTIIVAGLWLTWLLVVVYTVRVQEQWSPSSETVEDGRP